MASKAIKRRNHTATATATASVDTDRQEEEEEGQMEAIASDPITEPLLGRDSYETQSKSCQPRRSQEFFSTKARRCLHWANLLQCFVSQTAKRIARIATGFGSFLGRLFYLPFSNQNEKTKLHLTPLQEERLRDLRQRLEVPFDITSVLHQDALKELWRLAYPTRELPPLKSDLWKDMGWQGSDPSKDFRGGGFMSLENLIFFAKNYPESFHRLLHKEDGKRAEWEYPFAVAGINISYMLVQMLDLQQGKLTSGAGLHFVALLEDDEMAFDNFFCVTFQMLDVQWLRRGASYMEFNEVLKATRAQIEQELAQDSIFSIQDMPSYRMLRR